ncbi:Coupling protein TraD [Crateriforma conspicua]|uniref:Coupling protein TraD n=1 Tax=Crateriforma conspicua TaxID=2527996 RepID=A0A5C6FPC9_9PLAN|nr:type IV secretion system DNA-binding domain-containing protein [Crateriforma conspicua]TWU62366.1 Coupling protein TraD [Crateriforma conspicua]
MNRSKSSDDPILFQCGFLLVDNEEVTTHQMLVGASGAGKTTLIRLFLQDVVPAIAKEPDWRMLITNPKGDALSTLHGIQPSGLRIVTMDPFDDRGVAWDMCADVTEPRTALQLAYTLLPKRNESQPFFSDAARHIIYGVLLSFLHRKIQWTFADLLRALQGVKTIKRVLAASKYSRNIIDQYFYDKRLISNIVSTIAANLLPFGPVAACWESATERISLRDWVRGNFVIVLGNSDESREAVEVINQCMVRRAIELLLAMPDSFTRRSFFVFDEVAECGKLPMLESLMKRGRSKGASVTLAFQSIAGLRNPTMYGPHGTAEILGQVQHKVIGRLECPETAKWASELFGEQEIKQTTKSTSRTYAEKSSRSESTTEHFVTRAAVLPSEFMDLEPCCVSSGLSAFYLSAAYGAFQSTMDGPELFEEMLVPRSESVQDFIPRSVQSQFLEPWSRKRRIHFAPEPKLKRDDRQRAPEPQQQASILSALDEL